MRVISKFHDFYDTIGQYDGEHDDIFLRKQSSVPTNDLLHNRYSVRVLGFCGRFYPFVVTIDSKHAKPVCQYDKAIIEKVSKIDRSFMGNRYWINEFVEWYFHKSDKFDPTLFIEYQTPIFVTEIGKVTTLNPILREYDFQTQKDPWTAWNEIDRFRQEHFRIQEPMSMKITDEDMAIKKGLGGNKYDFRQPPTKKEKSRKRRKNK
jgi:hypothetical protein